MARTKQSVIESESKTSKVTSKKEPVKASKVPPKKETVKATAPKKETVKASKVPPKKETKAPAKKETKVSAKKEVVKTSKLDLEALEKRLEACEKAIKLAVEEAAFVRKALDNVKDDKSELVEAATAETTTEATTEVSDESEKKVDVKTLKKPELISKLLELGIKEADVKRVDGNKGKPTIADFRAALEKALSKNAKKDSKPKETLPKKKEEKAPKKVEKEKVEVNIDLKKGYGIDKDGFVYTLTKPRQVVAKLVKDKPTPLVAADMAKLKKMDIPHEKKTAAELKKLLVPLSDESEEDVSEVAGRSGTEGTTETTMSSLEDSSDDSTGSSSSESSSLADSSESEPTPKKEKKTKVEKKKPSIKVVEESESTVANTEEDKVVDVTEKEVADGKAEGTETVKADDSSSSSSSSSSTEGAEEGAEISKHFEKVPEITENDFKKVVVAVYKKDINLEDSVKVNAEKLGMDQTKVGQIISKYNHFSSKWPAVIQAAKNTNKPATTNKPGARQLLKPSRK